MAISLVAIIITAFTKIFDINLKSKGINYEICQEQPHEWPKGWVKIDGRVLEASKSADLYQNHKCSSYYIFTNDEGTQIVRCLQSSWETNLEEEHQRTDINWRYAK